MGNRESPLSSNSDIIDSYKNEEEKEGRNSPVSPSLITSSASSSPRASVSRTPTLPAGQPYHDPDGDDEQGHDHHSSLPAASSPESVANTSDINRDLENATNVMRENIKKTLERGQAFDTLQDQASKRTYKERTETCPVRVHHKCWRMWLHIYNLV